MWWGWNPGRKFIHIEGKADTTAAITGVMDGDLTYHIGTDALVRSITLTKNVSTTDDKSVSYSLELNVNTMFNNVDFRTEFFSKTMNSTEAMQLAMKIANNTATAITVQ